MKRWILVFTRILQMLVIYTLLRCLFLIYNWHTFESIDFDKIQQAFLLGIRFDISTVILVGAPFYILWLFPIPQTTKGKFFETVSEVIYVFWNTVFILFSVADTEYVAFNGRRLTRAMYKIKDDANEQAKQLVVHYWFLVLAALIIFIFLLATFPRRKKRIFTVSWPATAAGTFILILLGGIGVRGGLQDKPLREAHAFIFADSNLGTLALNSAFTVIHSKSHEPVKHLDWVKPDEIQKYLTNDKISKAHGILKGQNVVIFILESFALEYMGEVNGRAGYTPFLDELAQKGIFFKYNFANGRRSIEAIPAILASLPSILSEPFLMSDLQHVQIVGLPQKLRGLGYKSLFFHGAKNGSMFFDSFSDRIGFEEYHGMNEYPNADRDTDGFWGIYDEPFLRNFKDTLSMRSEPFFATLFTLSSHQPYHVPSQLKGRFPKGTLEIHESIGYTDYALRKFFEEAKSQPWFKNTLFVFTGDHTQKSDDPKYATELGYYRVPLILYHPTIQLPTMTGREITQHRDIMPTLLDLLGLDAPTWLGQSAFAEAKKFVVNRTADGYWYLDDHIFMRMSFDQKIHAWEHRNLEVVKELELDQVTDEIKRLKSYIQYYQNSVVDNSFIHQPSGF